MSQALTEHVCCPRSDTVSSSVTYLACGDTLEHRW